MPKLGKTSLNFLLLYFKIYLNHENYSLVYTFCYNKTENN